MACIFHGSLCECTPRPPDMNPIWEKTLPNGTQLIGIKGDGSHTHIGKDFISIRDEKTGKGIRWDI